MPDIHIKISAEVSDLNPVREQLWRNAAPGGVLALRLKRGS
jgi:hypothetical protein